jgi:hypothetical protein
MADDLVDEYIRQAQEELEYANRIAESRTPAFHLSRAQVFALIALARATENRG